MEKFKYGIMVIDPKKPLPNGDYKVIHFVGYWEELDWDVEAERLREELRTDPDFEYYREIVDRLLFYPATEDCLKFYNDMSGANTIFFDEPNQN